jgi:hypothetical protein
MNNLIKKLEKGIKEALKENAKILKRGVDDMDDHDSIIYNDGLVDGLERAIELLNKLNNK